MDFDFESEPLGQDHDGNDVFLKDIWPVPEDVERTIAASINKAMFTEDYADVFAGDERWRSLPTPEGDTFDWNGESTYVRKPPYFDGMTAEPAPVADIEGARVLAKLGDSVTTDHISPAGSIKADSPAGRYLAGARRRAQGLQLLRLAPRQPRGHDPRHVRQHPPARTCSSTASRAASPATSPTVASRRRSTTRRRPTRLRASRWSSSPARSTAPARPATGPPRARACSASGRSSPRATSGSTGRTSSAWACIPLQFPAGRERRVARPRRHRDVLDLRDHRAQRGPHPPDGPRRGDRRGRLDDVEFDAVVRIDTPGEADYYRNGGILQYVLRSLVAS